MPAVQSVLDKYSGVFDAAVDMLHVADKGGLLQLEPPTFFAKPKFDGLTARETTLVDSSLSMVDAVRACTRLYMPDGQGCVDTVLQSVVGEIAGLGRGVKHERALRRSVVREVVQMVAPATKELQRLVPPFLVPIVGHVDFGFYEVIVRATGWVHDCVVDSLVCGFPPVGVIPWCGCHRPIPAEPPPKIHSREDNVKTFDDAVRILEKRARREASDPGSLQDQQEIWRVTMEEVDKEFCVGPLSRGAVERMFKHVVDGPSCIPAFGIWQKGKLRRIDDAAISDHNLRTQMLETIVCDTADLPARMAAEFAKYFGFEECEEMLGLGTDDIGSAYRVCIPSANPEHTIAAVWKPEGAGGDGDPGVYYFVLRGFNFGLKSAPLHLATVLSPLIHFSRVFMLACCGRFYDDVAVVDPKFGGVSAQQTLDFLFARVGFPFAPKKHERIRASNPFLGMVSDFSSLALGWVLIRVKEQRRRRLIAELNEVLRAKKLTPAHAARIRGKLYFTTCSAFYGVGRPALQAITARQYNKHGSSKLTPELKASLTFFVFLLRGLPSRRHYVRRDKRPPLFVWSDAMYEARRDGGGEFVQFLDEESGEYFYVGEANIAFLVFDAIECEWHTAAMYVGIDIIRQMVPGKKTYIGQLEALAAAAVLETLPESLLRDRSAIMWVDNLGAKYGLQKGYSKVPDSGRIINAFKLKQAALRMRVWFEYVPSEQNIADLPSRGWWDAMYDAISAVSGDEWTCISYMMKVPDFSSWLAPLSGFVRSAVRKRHGSRGAKRNKRQR